MALSSRCCMRCLVRVSVRVRVRVRVGAGVKVRARARAMVGVRAARGAWGALEAVSLGMDTVRAAVGSALARQRRGTACGAVLARPAREALELLRPAVVLARRAGRAFVHTGTGCVAAGRARLRFGRARRAGEAGHALLALLGGSEVGGVAVGAAGAERGLRGTCLAELARRAQQANGLATRGLVLAR